jgi:hypothetical protein
MSGQASNRVQSQLHPPPGPPTPVIMISTVKPFGA